MRPLFVLFTLFVSSCNAQEAKHYFTLCNLPIAASPATTNVSVTVDNKPASDISWKVTDSPRRIMIVNDTSGSLRDQQRQRVALEAVRDLARASRPEDKLGLVNFNQDAFLDINVKQRDAFLKETEDPGIIKHFVGAGGTALFDALESTANQLSQDRHEGDAIVLISDGDDNSSRHGSRQVSENLNKAGVRVYMLALTGSAPPRAVYQLVMDSGGVVIGSAKNAFKNKPESLSLLMTEIQALSRVIQQPVRVDFSLPGLASAHSKLKVTSTSSMAKNVLSLPSAARELLGFPVVLPISTLDATLGGTLARAQDPSLWMRLGFADKPDGARPETARDYATNTRIPWAILFPAIAPR